MPTPTEIRKAIFHAATQSFITTDLPPQWDKLNPQMQAELLAMIPQPPYERVEGSRMLSSIHHAADAMEVALVSLGVLDATWKMPFGNRYELERKPMHTVRLESHEQLEDLFEHFSGYTRELSNGDIILDLEVMEEEERNDLCRILKLNSTDEIPTKGYACFWK